MTPQDTDFGKSLIMFAEGQEVVGQATNAMNWLRFQLAGYVYGLDKATMEERLAWIDIPENRHMVWAIVNDPIDNIAFGKVLTSLGVFLAAAEEWVAINYEQQNSHICLSQRRYM